jgi:hypothetical protein
MLPVEGVSLSWVPLLWPLGLAVVLPFLARSQVKLQDVQVESLQRKAHEAEAKLKKQQAMYESVRSDRNMYSKNLVDVQEEIEVMNLSFRTLSHQASWNPPSPAPLLPRGKSNCRLLGRHGVGTL